MTKFLTAAAWSALVLGGAAVADTPPAESADVVTEETTTEVESEVTTIRYGDAAEVEAEAEKAPMISAVTIEGEADSEAEGEELEDDADASTETDSE